MSINLNRATIVGYVGGDPEVKGRESTFVIFSVATSRRWRERETGDKREVTHWHRVVLYAESAAKFAKEYIKKGDLVMVEGALEYRKWKPEDSDREITIAEIVVRPYDGQIQSLSKDRNGGESRKEEPKKEEKSSGSRPSWSRELDDEIPF